MGWFWKGQVDYKAIWKKFEVGTKLKVGTKLEVGMKLEARTIWTLKEKIGGQE